MWKFGPAHRTVHVGFFLCPMSCPHPKTLKMKIVSTANFTPTETHILPHLLLTNRTNCLFPKHHSLHLRFFCLSNPSLFYFSVQKLTRQLWKLHFLWQRSRTSLLYLWMFTCQKILELTVNVCGLPNDWIINCHSEDLQQDIDGMDAVIASLRSTRTAQLWPNLSAIFVIQSVLEGET